MTKTIAILLNGEIHHDYRVIKVMQTLSKKHHVHLFYINGNLVEDIKLFSENVTLHPSVHRDTLKVKLLRNSFFCYEFNFLIQKVLDTKIAFDCIWANDLTTLYPAYKISEKLSCKLIYDSHEIYLETLNQYFPRDAQGLKKIIINRLLSIMRNHGRAIESKLISKCKLFITVNESLMDYFKSNYSIGKNLVLMNLPRLSDQNNDRFDIREKFEWNDESMILLYQGALNEGRGLKILIDALKILPNEFKLIILGKGTLKKELENKVIIENLQERIRFIDRVELSILPKYTNSCDFGINLLESYNLSKQMASPNKLFEYIFANIPIIASNTAENKKILEKYEVGCLTENEPEAIKNAVIKVLSMDKDLVKIQCLEAKNVYNWESQESQLLSMLFE